MEIIDFALTPSLISQYMAEMRDAQRQRDALRFRTNIRRVGQIMAYEISRRLRYRNVTVQTPLAPCQCQELDEQVVLATIFRAGLPFHEGFLSYFDHAENAFVSAYRKYHEGQEHDQFDVMIEYLASPRLEGKTLILCDPMLATGSSMELSYRALITKGQPAHIHVASVIASQQGVEAIRHTFPQDTTVWIGAIDPQLNAHSYIVPGLGDAGDLAYGVKEE